MKKRIYTDTSVIGGCLDEEFKEDSLKIFAEFIAGKSILLLSELVIIELEHAPQSVNDILKQVPEHYIEKLIFSDEANELAHAYISEKVIPEHCIVDAQHIATATIHKANVLISWNFKHIVNLDKIHGYNAVNLKLSYPMIEIRTPTEVLHYEI